MNSLIAVTKWIETSSTDEFLANFKSLGDNYSGITLAEYLEEYGVIEDESDLQNIFTTDDFIYGAEIKEYDDSDFHIIESINNEDVLIQKVIQIDFNVTLNSFEATNDSPYCETQALAA